MIEVQQDRTSTRVIPALIHIQELQPGRTAEEPHRERRRIIVLLDHPVVKQLGWFSWALTIVALAATHKVATVPIGLLVMVGLLVGVINGTRWLFARKR